MPSPNAVISVCPGGQVELLCNTTDGVGSPTLLWNITIPHIGGDIGHVSTRSSQLDLPLNISNIYFNITRDSIYDTQPLVSTLSVTNVTAALNGTIVECRQRQTQILTNTINVIRTGHGGKS